MTFSGEPEEKYSVSDLLRNALGILKAIGKKFNYKQPEFDVFDESLKQLEDYAENLVKSDMQDDYHYPEQDPGMIEYKDIIEQINAIERNWLDGSTYE